MARPAAAGARPTSSTTAAASILFLLALLCPSILAFILPTPSHSLSSSPRITTTTTTNPRQRFQMSMRPDDDSMDMGLGGGGGGGGGRSSSPMTSNSGTFDIVNQVMLIGRLGSEPMVKYLDSGNCVLSVSLAVTRDYQSPQKAAAGEPRECDWIRLEAWGRTAEMLAQNARKGSRLMVVGGLTTNSWTDKYGQNRSDMKVKVRRAEVLQSSMNGGGGGGGGNGGEMSYYNGGGGGGAGVSNGGGGGGGGMAAASGPWDNVDMNAMMDSVPPVTSPVMMEDYSNSYARGGGGGGGGGNSPYARKPPVAAPYGKKTAGGGGGGGGGQQQRAPQQVQVQTYADQGGMEEEYDVDTDIPF